MARSLQPRTDFLWFDAGRVCIGVVARRNQAKNVLDEY
jgi:hypothetical protein